MKALLSWVSEFSVSNLYFFSMISPHLTLMKLLVSRAIILKGEIK